MDPSPWPPAVSPDTHAHTLPVKHKQTQRLSAASRGDGEAARFRNRPPGCLCRSVGNAWRHPDPVGAPGRGRRGCWLWALWGRSGGTWPRAPGTGSEASVGASGASRGAHAGQGDKGLDLCRPARKQRRDRAPGGGSHQRETLATLGDRPRHNCSDCL